MDKWNSLLHDKLAAKEIVLNINNQIKSRKLEKELSQQSYRDIFQPVTEGQESITKAINQMSSSIQPLSITYQPPSIESPIVEAQPAISMEEEAETSIDIDKDIPKDFLINNNFPSPSAVFQKRFSNEALDYLIKKVSDKSKGVRRGSSEKTHFQKYSDRLKAMKTSGLLTGTGIQLKRNAYKINKNMYGELYIDMQALYGFKKLIAKDKNNKVVINEPIDDSFIDLITKRYNPKRKYSPHAMKIFLMLNEKSNLPIHQTSGKYKICSPVIYYNNPEELVDKLELVIGSMQSGNNSTSQINEGIKIIDELLKIKKITPEEHEILFNNHFSIWNKK